ncbi:trigger factor [Patescibacteria group bacterium]
MSLEIKQLPKSEIEITGEIPAEEFSAFWPKALKDLSKDASIPGFRKGKIPENILIDKIGEGAVLDKSAEMALQEVYPKIIKEKKIEAIGMPQATVTKIAKGSELGFKFKTAILPEIKLPENFKEVASKFLSKKEDLKVEDKEVDEAIEYIRKSRAKGEKKELPELNDEFAKSVGNFETMDELKKTINDNLKQEKEFKQQESKRLESLDAILKESKYEIPDILIDSEKHKMLHELQSNITNMGMKWEDYLGQIKKKEEEILEGWTEDAERRVKYGLILRRIHEELKIDISEEEIKEKCKELGVEDLSKPEVQGAKDYAYGIIRNEKIFKSLENLN